MTDLKYILTFVVAGLLLVAACKKKENKGPFTLPESCDSLIMITDSGHNFHFPNAFTPNNDGRNDMYRAISMHNSVGNYRLSILRLNGEVVYETTDLRAGWDGRDKNKEMSTDFLFQVNVKGITPATQATDVCTHLYLLPPGPDNCVRFLTADPKKLLFEDQYHIESGESRYTTGEKLCY